MAARKKAGTAPATMQPEPSNVSAGARTPNNNRRVIFTGQVGLDKSLFIRRIKDEIQALLKRAFPDEDSRPEVHVHNVGQMMYEEEPSIRRGRILWVPPGRLRNIRRAVFRDILQETSRGGYHLINAHAAFRWNHGLFRALDLDQLRDLSPTMWITVVDSLQTVHARLMREHRTLRASLKDVLDWREEEILASDIYSEALGLEGRHYVVARGPNDIRAVGVARLIIDPNVPKAYPSFPMTFINRTPEVRPLVEEFRALMTGPFVVFDPGDIDEKRLTACAKAAKKKGQKTFNVVIDGEPWPLSVAEVLSIDQHIEAQIIARDFRLIDQSDAICSLIPEDAEGKPVLSSGVERELAHAYEMGRVVGIVWRSKNEGSPFITANADIIAPTPQELIERLLQSGLLKEG